MYNPGYSFNRCIDNKGNILQQEHVITLPPKLYLGCGEVEYYFPEHFSHAELWWLSKELSDFLNLEMQIIYPTPKLPLPTPYYVGHGIVVTDARPIERV